VLVDRVVVVLDPVVVVDDKVPLPSPALPELNVDPIGPNLIFEKTTFEFGTFASTSDGAPDEVAHDPRAAPGADAVAG